MAQLTVLLRERELSCHQLGDRTLIGREPGSEIFIDNAGISRHHASVARTPDGYVLRDEGSQNGVFVNGEQVQEFALKDGDVVQVGKFLLRFAEADTAAARPSTQPPPRHDTDPRALLKTFALRPDEVQKLMGESYRPSSAPPQFAVDSARSRLRESSALPTPVVIALAFLALVAVGAVAFLIARG